MKTSKNVFKTIAVAFVAAFLTLTASASAQNNVSDILGTKKEPTQQVAEQKITTQQKLFGNQPMLTPYEVQQQAMRNAMINLKNELWHQCEDAGYVVEARVLGIKVDAALKHRNDLQAANDFQRNRLRLAMKIGSKGEGYMDRPTPGGMTQETAQGLGMISMSNSMGDRAIDELYKTSDKLYQFESVEMAKLEKWLTMHEMEISSAWGRMGEKDQGAYCATLVKSQFKPIF